MKDAIILNDIIAKSYSSLSSKLQEAADYVIENPLEIATRSLRSISQTSNLSTATFSRLAKSLGFTSYEHMRENSRNAIGEQLNKFSDKAKRLRKESQDISAPSFLTRQSRACEENIRNQESTIDVKKLNLAVEQIAAADKIVAFAALASTFIAEYFIYLSRWFMKNSQLVGRSGDSFASALSNLTANDCAILISKAPYAKQVCDAAKIAAQKKAYIIVITDSHTCPAYQYADIGFIVPSESPQFFSSYAGTIVLLETLIGMLVTKIGAAAESRISEVEKQNTQLRTFY
jgi:DNA-binding MurR/RpiR family transcriptional regulator